MKPSDTEGNLLEQTDSAPATNHVTRLSQTLVPTRSDDGSVVHEDHRVGFVQELDAVGAKDSGLPPEQLHDAFVHEAFGHVGVDRRQRVVEEVDVFVLRRRETRETPDRRRGGRFGGRGRGPTM